MIEKIEGGIKNVKSREWQQDTVRRQKKTQQNNTTQKTKKMRNMYPTKKKLP